VLKSELSEYNDERWPWVKLKADYIPGCGDCVDFVCFGASWSKERARDFNVGTDTFTDFLVGTLADGGFVRDQPAARVRIRGVFSVSWLRSRAELEEFNFMIRSELGAREYQSKPSIASSYCVEIGPRVIKPRVLFEHPVLCEVYGAGFTKARGQNYYELRFPRISKVWRKDERVWTESVTASQLHDLALQSIGRDSAKLTLSRLVNQHWGDCPTATNSNPLKRKAIMDEWIEKLSSGRRLNQLSNLSLLTTQDSPSRETKWFESGNSETLSPSTDDCRLPAPTMPAVRAARSESWTNVFQQPVIMSSRSMGSIVRSPASVRQSENILESRSFSSLCAAQVAGASTKFSSILPSGASSLGWDEMRKEMFHSAVFIDKDTNIPRPHWWSSFLDLVPKSNRMSTLGAVFSALDRAHAGDKCKMKFKQGIVFLGLPSIEKLGTLKHKIHFIAFSLEELYSQLSSEAQPLSMFQLSPLETSSTSGSMC